MKRIRTAFGFILLVLLSACGSVSQENKIKDTVAEYYEVYQKREDFQQFLDFYSEDIILEDIITGDRKVGKEAFSNFFDWDNPNFEKVDSVALIVTEQFIDGNNAVTKGYFTPFKWGELEFEAMHFTTILIFDESGKIIKHVDWLNYPNNLLDYAKRKNSNDWIR